MERDASKRPIFPCFWKNEERREKKGLPKKPWMNNCPLRNIPRSSSRGLRMSIARRNWLSSWGSPPKPSGRKDRSGTFPAKKCKPLRKGFSMIKRMNKYNYCSKWDIILTIHGGWFVRLGLGRAGVFGSLRHIPGPS